MESFAEMVGKYRELQCKIRRLSLKIEELEKSGGYSSPKFNGGIRATGAGVFESEIEKIIELKNEREKLENICERLRKKIDGLIDKLKNYSAQEIVSLKVFSNSGWKMITETVNYSKSRARQIYYESLYKIDEFTRTSQEKER